MKERSVVCFRALVINLKYLIFVSADVAIKKAVAIEMRHLQIQLFVTGKSNFQSSYYFYDLM